MTVDALTGAIAIGRYKVEGLAAHGGMASVYRALDPVLSRPVAVKVLHAHLAADPRFVARFRHEALAAAGLSHPGVIAIFDTGKVGDRPCLVMEYLSGGSLADRIGRRPLTAEEAVAVGVTVARALHEAHRRGLVHRDVKPGNILFTESGTAKLGDFGIATAGGEQFTRTGQLIGTARYLAPELLRGQTASPASDQFSLGVVLYEALAGEPPFGGERDPTGGLVRPAPVPPLETIANVPAAIARVIDRAMDPSPGARFADLDSLARALTAAMRSSGAAPVGAPRPCSPASAAAPVGPPTARFRPAAEPLREAPDGRGRAARRPDPVLRESRPTPGLRGGRQRPLRRRQIGRTLAAVFGILILLAGGVTAIVLAGRTDGSSGSTAPTSSAGTAPVAIGARLELVSAKDFDPFGAPPEENPAEAGLAIDGDPNTSWTTSGYLDAVPFPNFKAGVGIYVELNEPQTVSGVQIRSATPGWTADIRIGTVGQTPTRLEDFGSPVEQMTADQPAATFPAIEARRVLVWITRLTVPAPDGRTRMAIAEIEVAAG